MVGLGCSLRLRAFDPWPHGSAQTPIERPLSSWKRGLCASMFAGGIPRCDFDPPICFSRACERTQIRGLQAAPGGGAEARPRVGLRRGCWETGFTFLLIVVWWLKSPLFAYCGLVVAIPHFAAKLEHFCSPSNVTKMIYLFAGTRGAVSRGNHKDGCFWVPRFLTARQNSQFTSQPGVFMTQ